MPNRRKNRRLTCDEAGAAEATKAAEAALTSVAFSADGSRLAAGAENGTITVWDAATGKSLDLLTGAGGQFVVLPLRQTAEKLVSQQVMIEGNRLER